jgi:AcrR family transcriptional regulator
MMIAAVEDVAIRLFHERGFAAVTVDEIATKAQISVRTYYRYFPTKEYVLQVNVDRRAAALRVALAARPADEPPLRSLREALTETIRAEDSELLRRWIAVITGTPDVIPGVLGGAQLKLQRVIASFLAERSGMDADAFEPTVLAAAIGGTVQASMFRWFTGGRELSTLIAEGLDALALLAADPATWSTGAARSA